MNIFGNPVQTEEHVWSVQETKNHNFRQQIRRSHLEKRFRNSRNEQIKFLRSLKFLEEVKNEKDNYNTPRKIQQLLEGLEQGRNNANFYYNINQMNLDVILLDHLRNRQLSICQKSKFLKVLIQLTYFCPRSISIIIKQTDSVQQIMASVRYITVEDEQNINYLEMVVTFLLNLSGKLNPDFNNFLIQYDFIIPLMNNIQKITRNSPQKSYHLRDITLRLHLNLINEKTLYEQFFLRQLSIILSDFNFMKFNIKLVFSCLKNISKIKDLLQLACRNNVEMIKYIEDAIEQVQISSDDDYEVFLQFLIELQITGYSQAKQIFGLVDIKEFLNRMLEFYENKSHKKYLKCCRIFSKTALEDQPLSEIFEDNDIEAFIKSLINIQCFKYIYDGKYCLVILIMLLKEDQFLLDMMIDNGLFDFIPELVEHLQFEEIAFQTINFIETVMKVWQSLKEKGKKGKNQSIVEIFHNKGFILPIQDLQNRDQKEVSTRAESFMNWISQISNKN